MALIKCHECGQEVSTAAEKCPNCGAPVKSKSNTARVLVTIVIAGAAAFWFFGGGLERSAQQSMDDITAQVARDEVAKYEIAKSGGTKMDLCVAAMSVAAAYLQAKDQPNYQRWKSTESADCTSAGLPR